MRCFKRNFEKIGSAGPYFCGFRLRVLTSTILRPSGYGWRAIGEASGERGAKDGVLRSRRSREGGPTTDMTDESKRLLCTTLTFLEAFPAPHSAMLVTLPIYVLVFWSTIPESRLIRLNSVLGRSRPTSRLNR